MDGDVLAETDIVRGARVPFGTPRYSEVVDFLFDEATLLDEDRVDEWLELLAEDLRYWMPIRVDVERGSGSSFDPLSGLFDDDIASMRMRVLKTHTTSFWSEDPPSRVHRAINNVVVYETGVADEYAVTSYLFVTRNRWDNPRYDLIVATRHDLLRLTDDGWKIARRTILHDQTLLGTPNLSLFL